MEAGQELSVLEVGAKCQSKRTLYYPYHKSVPSPIAYANQKYLSGICTGHKLFFRCSEVKVVKVPHIKGLGVASILEFAYRTVDFDKYLS